MRDSLEQENRHQKAGTLRTCLRCHRRTMSMDKKTLIIMDQDDIDDFKQLLDLIYTELSEFNDTVRQQLDPEEDDDV